MRIAAELSNSDSPNGRRSRRTSLHTIARYREGSARGQVDIVDLSATGARIESHLLLHEDTFIWLKLPGLEALHARIAWVDRHVAGCEFVNPLHPAVFDRLVTVCRQPA